MTVDRHPRIEPTSTRVHFGARESVGRAGGMHTVMRGLAIGQKAIGLSPVLVDQIGPDGSFDAIGDDSQVSFEGAIAEFHFAHGARPILAKASIVPQLSRKVFHFHGPWAAEGRVQGDSIIRAMSKWIFEYDTYRRFDSFIAASKAFADVLSRNYGVPPGRISVVHPGIDIDRFVPAANRREIRRRFGIDPDRTTFVTVRRLEPRMGIGLALEAMLHFPDAQLLIAGTGSLAESLPQEAIALGIGGRVHFAGRVSDLVLPEVYQAADVVLVPSLALEGFGMTVLEAFASGVPVVASRLGGLPEALGPFAEESAFSPGSVGSLVDAVRRNMAAPHGTTTYRTFAESRSLPAAARDVEAVLLG